MDKEGEPMRLLITVKSLGKKNNYITKQELNVVEKPQTLRELIAEIVSNAVAELNGKISETPLVNYLTHSEIKLQSVSGKVGFGATYNDQHGQEKIGIETAISAFQDGLYKVFVRETEIEQLDCPLELQDNDEVAFIKFTMLAGRMW